MTNLERCFGTPESAARMEAERQRLPVRILVFEG